ncbi:MAG: NAD-dependent epimerase/dehydratase family protein [candidate division KSB1 bacterium]|nr:NAD-dependent epimerase/dehydratase family protein [candidate division KSB1 bacterium]MDZ7355965.1 NAD-dependent epimerase/dehydratase family protein [candidate division KSB1 bacterium]MDZ7377433.1 NAD-dependent epimerase/dehydratase family protein [candidate division KSB1 bacterium]MDZ7400701.1 NAD-dependent epimerase/dehydratase family protein [candidate division KSB1 bacterium]
MNFFDQFKNKRVLITGGAGFIGSNLAHYLVKCQAKVTIIDSMIPDYGGNLHNLEGILDKVAINFSDVRDRYGMQYLIKGQDYLFNLAGQVSHIDSMRDPFADLEINAKSQLSILEACRHFNPEIRIVFASTRQIYGRAKYLPVDENHPLDPPDVNGINKLAGERYHTLYSKVYGLHCSVLRLTNVYGPRQLMKHDRQGFIGWFIRQIVRGERIKIFGTGEQKRDLVFVDDVVDALLRAACSNNANGKIYNIGGAEPISLKKLVELMIEINGGGKYELVPFPDERKKIDIGDFYTDYKKIANDLGWKPTVLLREGLKRTIEYYRQHGEYYWT